MYGNVRGSLVSALLLFVVALFPSACHAEESASDANDERIMLHLEALYSAFVNDSTVSDDAWWIDLVPTNCTPDDLGRISLELAEREVVLTGLLAEFKPPVALADSIEAFLKRPRATIYYQGSSISMGRTSANDLANITDRFEFCFIPRINDNGELAVQFYPEWGALLIPAIDWPAPVLAGLIYHEGGHAYLSTRTLLPEDAQDAYLLPIEAKILDTTTNGSAFDLADSILARGAPDVELITLADVRAFARLLKADNSGPIVATAVFNQFMRLMSVRMTALAQGTPADKITSIN